LEGATTTSFREMSKSMNIDAKELAARVFGPGAEPLPGFGNAFRAALAELGERERTVFLQRLAGKTLEEVGKKLGVTRERVRQIEARAIRRLRERTIKYISTELHPPPPPPLSVEDIERLLAHASRDQREAWRKFRDTFSPEQTMLWRKYWLLGSRARRGRSVEEQRALVWKEFTNSLTDEQRALWRAYRRASAYTRKVRTALRRAREGRMV
jgi:DNA-binding CsgD family transcriptional regulator